MDPMIVDTTIHDLKASATITKWVVDGAYIDRDET
jgi:hypothetical protein